VNPREKKGPAQRVHKKLWLKAGSFSL